MAEYHPFSEAVFSDPHSVYRTLREESPVHYVEEYGCWAYALFEDVWNACQDPETYTAAEGTTSGHLLLNNLEVFPALDMMDPPRHTHTRALVSGFFTPGKIRRLEEDFRNIVKMRLQVVRERGVMDVVRELGSHLSTLSVCRVLGLPGEDGEMLRGYVDAVFSSMWEKGCKMDDAQVIGTELSGAGLDAPALIAASQTPEVKARLLANTEQAFHRGAFGSPTFLAASSRRSLMRAASRYVACMRSMPCS